MENTQFPTTNIESDNEPSSQKLFFDTMEKNRELLERIYESSEKTRKYIFWLRVAEIVKLMLIVVPLVIGLFFVVPLLKNFQNILNLYTGGDIMGQ